MRLNRRHKAALCGTLVCLGLILLYGHLSLRHLAGILFLGLAYSWAIGSNSRIVHWLFISFGFLLLLGYPFSTGPVVIHIVPLLT
jgi:hypothetical protein